MFYEMAHAVLGPARAASDAMRLFYRNPLNPLTHTVYGRSVSAACELFERVTRRYGKPIFDLPQTMVNGQPVDVIERVVWRAPFCNLIHFDRALPVNLAPQRRLLIVAPMSGHFATLLRGTVEAFLPTHEVYITDWVDARMVSLSQGGFDLDDYIDYLRDMIRLLGPDVHVMAVCQPSVPVIAAIALMEEENDPATPRSMTLMGGPIDTRCSPTEVNKVAQKRGIEWFRTNCIARVPFTHPGLMR
jgi:poly(3-hydroxybutyrate) depolymerase